MIMVAALVLALLQATARAATQGGGAQAGAPSAHGGIDVVMLGDSNTSIGGDACDRPAGWNKWFRDRFAPATCRSYARSGATWTNTPRTVRDVEQDIAVLGDNNVVYNQVERLAEAAAKGIQPQPELILIAAGTNDAWFAAERPQALAMAAADAFAADSCFITSRPVGSVLTLAESVRYCCELLMELFPGAQIALITPPQTTMAAPGRIDSVGSIIEECGRRMSLAVLRLDHQGAIYATAERLRRRNTYDGTHTTEACARRHGYLVAAWAASVLQF